MERIMENENKVKAQHKEILVGEDSTHGLGFGLFCSGPQAVMGRTKAIKGLDEPKASLSQVIDLQLFQIGPKKSAIMKWK